MEEALPKVYDELAKTFETLEGHYRDMQDIEFTVEQGKLWMLQTRTGKRTARAALKIAVDIALTSDAGPRRGARRDCYGITRLTRRSDWRSCL